MILNIPHHKTRKEAVEVIDKGVDNLLATGIPSVELVNPVKTWADNEAGASVMTFSLTGKMGFIKLPLSGTVTVTPTEVIVFCELPQMVKNFLGEAKVQAGVENQIKGLLA